jgi:RNA polymerase sigma-70 factor (ECF subfamily)
MAAALVAGRQLDAFLRALTERRDPIMEHDPVTQHFEQHRTHLQRVAYRMLGSLDEAEDAVQETWLRLNRSDTREVENLGGWLTTVISRLCLDTLRARRTRNLEPTGTDSEASHGPESASDPEQEALLADSVGLAMLVVLETLPPAERVAFVLHDMFAIPFEEIAPIVGRSVPAARQLASRGRRRVHGESPLPERDRKRQREVVDAFLSASRDGDFEALLAVLDPAVVFRADGAASPSGRPTEILGVSGVARAAAAFASRAQFSRAALVNGSVGIIIAPRGRLFAVVHVKVVHDKIAQMELVAEPGRLQTTDVAVLDG